MKKRLIAWILFACTLLLCACTKGQNEEQTTSDTKENVVGEYGDSLFIKIKDDLPDNMDFGGEKITMVLRGTDPRFYSEFVVDATDVNVVSSAVFERNTIVEDRLNIVIDFYTGNIGPHGPWAEIQNSILAGACNYDVAAGSSVTATSHALQGTYRNLRNIDNIDLSKEYWSQGLIENMTLSEATYFATGSISTYFYDSAFVIYMNKDLATNWGINPDEVYKTVLDGDWTLDNMILLTKDIYSDLNGNGVDGADLYGFGLQVTSATDGFYSSCEIPCTTILDDGNIEYAMDLERVDDVCTKLKDFLWTYDGVAALAEGTGYVTDEIYLFTNQFANNQLVFVTDWLYSTSTDTMRNMKSNFGVLPYPKYDTYQTQYYTYAHDKLTVLGIPLTVPDAKLEMVGAFLEAMASGGQNTVMPAYYEKALTSRNIRDPESVKTMNLIVSNIVNDRIWFLYRQGATSLLRDQVWKKRDDLISTYRSTYDEINSYFVTMKDAYAKYADQ